MSKRIADECPGCHPCGQVLLAVAVEVTNDKGTVNSRSDWGRYDCRLKSAVTVSQLDSQFAGTRLAHGQVWLAVTVKVCDRQGNRGATHPGNAGGRLES